GGAGRDDPARRVGRVPALGRAARHLPPRRRLRMTLELELERPGRHRGALVLPWSRDESAYGQLVVPVIVLKGGPGPTLLLTAGVHGDEYEGQIVVPELART